MTNRAYFAQSSLLSVAFWRGQRQWDLDSRNPQSGGGLGPIFREQRQLAVNTARHRCGGRTRQPSLLTGMLFDGDGNRMTPSHAVQKSTHSRYYVSGSLSTKDRTETSAGLRIPAVEIEQLVSSRLHGWLLDPGSI